MPVSNTYERSNGGGSRMIGDVPKGAPLRCRLGRHAGQENGGTMVFQCSHCGGSFWQTKDYSEITRYADVLIANGQSEEALRLARDAVREGKTL